jgi:hypothetical protein
VFLPNNFLGITNFIFSVPVAVTPGTTYYLQPVQSGDGVGSSVTDGSYPGGTEIYQGSPIPDRDLWFREGIIVPEPSSMFLLAAVRGTQAREQRMGVIPRITRISRIRKKSVLSA